MTVRSVFCVGLELNAAAAAAIEDSSTPPITTHGCRVCQASDWGRIEFQIGRVSVQICSLPASIVKDIGNQSGEVGKERTPESADSYSRAIPKLATKVELLALAISFRARLSVSSSSVLPLCSMHSIS